MPENERPERLVFMGTPEFAASGLQAILDAGIHPVAVYTQPDRPAGRGRRPRPSPVKVLAESWQLPVLQPESLKAEAAQQTLAELAPDLILVIAYGQILPAKVLAIPALGCVNLHASLLPRWRGAAPIQRAIEAGDSQSGVCLMQMEAGLDTGPVLARASCPISHDMTGGMLHDQLAALGRNLLTRCLPGIARLQAKSQAQDDSLATYAHKLEKSEARLDLTAPAEVLARRIRAFNPWPVCWLELNGETFRIWSAQAETDAGDAKSDTPARPGAIRWPSPRRLDIGTGSGWLRLQEVQPRGKKPMLVQDWLNGLSAQQKARLEVN